MSILKVIKDNKVFTVIKKRQLNRLLKLYTKNKQKFKHDAIKVQ